MKPSGNFCRIYNQCHWWKLLGIHSAELWLAIGSVQKFWCRNHSDSNKKWGRHVKILLESLEVTHIFHFFQWKDHPNPSTPPSLCLVPQGYVQHVRRGTDGSWWPGSCRSFWISACRITGMYLGRGNVFFFVLLPAVGKGIKYIEMGTIIFCFGGVCIKLQTYNAWAFKQDQLVRVPIWST